MDRFDRIFELHKILKNRRTPISRKDLEGKLECSRATVRRLIEDSRDFLGSPIKYDRSRNGYYYDTGEQPVYELPGLWFNNAEIFALLTTHQLLAKVQPGLLEPHIAPIRQRLEDLLKHRHAGSKEVFKRIRILQMAPRATDMDTFRRVADALVSRKRIKMLYHGRERDKTTERWVSPQRLVYYRENWYLDAWCHQARGLRTFSLDRIRVIYVGEKARDLSEAQLDKHFGSAYGIFAGTPKHKAVIRFSGSAARWVADEHWHSQQESRLLPDGGWELTVPYSDPRELLMDILKYGPEVEVVAPASLRALVAERLQSAVNRYVSSN